MVRVNCPKMVMGVVPQDLGWSNKGGGEMLRDLEELLELAVLLRDLEGPRRCL